MPILPATTDPRGGDDVDGVSVLRIGWRHLRWGGYATSLPGRDGKDPGALRPPRREAAGLRQGRGRQAPSLSDKRRAAAKAGRSLKVQRGFPPRLRHEPGGTGASRLLSNWTARAPSPALPSSYQLRRPWLSPRAPPAVRDGTPQINRRRPHAQRCLDRTGSAA